MHAADRGRLRVADRQFKRTNVVDATAELLAQRLQKRRVMRRFVVSCRVGQLIANLRRNDGHKLGFFVWRKAVIGGAIQMNAQRRNAQNRSFHMHQF